MELEVRLRGRCGSSNEISWVGNDFKMLEVWR
jgi:hypothetical protein